MDFKTLQDHTFRLMRDPNQTRYSLDFVKKWLNEGERQYCKETSYSVKKHTTITTENGVREYDLPSDFLSEIAIFFDGIEIKSCELKDTIHQDGDHSGDVYAYYIENKKIGFEEIPTEAKTVTLIYYARGGGMVGDADVSIIPDEHHMLLVSYACKMAAIEGDDTRLAVFETYWRQGLAEAKADVIGLSPWPVVGQDTGSNLNPVTHDTEFIL